MADRGGEEGGVGHTGSAKEGVVAPRASKRMAAFSSSSTQDRAGKRVARWERGGVEGGARVEEGWVKAWENFVKHFSQNASFFCLDCKCT